jgi:hypothetical protein
VHLLFLNVLTVEHDGSNLGGDHLNITSLEMISTN